MKPQAIYEILPNRTRAAAMVGLSVAAWIFAYYMVNGHSFTQGLLADFLNHPTFSGAGPTNMDGPLFIIAVAAVILAINIYTVGALLVPVPRPRIRITPERFEYIGTWRIKSFAWSEFGRFSVKKVRTGKTTTIKVRALAPGVEEPTGIAGWFKSVPELLSFDLQYFVPMMQKNIEEGERMARWILEVRDGKDTPPPATLTVRVIGAPTSAAATPRMTAAIPTGAKAGPKMAKVTTNQTVVRR